MSCLMWSPLLANVVLAVAGPRLTRALPPRSAVRLLTLAMLVAAAGTGFVLAVLGFLVLAQVPPVAAVGHWSPVVLRAEEPVPAAAAALAGAAVLVLLVAALWRAVRGGHDLLRAALVCRRLGPSAQGLVVIDADEPDAYALPGLGGRVVVSTAMLRALPAEERHVLLAHEAAHLANHHHLYVQLAELAAAASPVLRPSARALRLAVEREADEAAAAEVGDRRLVARALARAGLARASASRGGGTSAVALAGADGPVLHRATALLAPAPPPRRALAALVAVLTLATLIATAVTAHQTDDRLDQAQVALTSRAH